MSKSEDDEIVNKMQDELSSSGLAAVQVQAVREAGKLVFKFSGPSDEDIKKAEKLLEGWN